MGAGGGTTLGGGAALTIGVAPAPVRNTQNDTLIGDLEDIWDYLTFQPVQKKITGGVIGLHKSIGGAALTVGLPSVSSDGHAALGGATLTITETPASTTTTNHTSGATLTISSSLVQSDIPNELTFFLLTGNWLDVESPPLISGNQAAIEVISASITLWPGYLDANGAAHAFPTGFTTFVENLDNGAGIGYDTAVALAPIGVRILDGQLEVIDRDNEVGVQLVANSPVLNLAAQGYNQLVYNVQFTNVVYAGAGRTLTNYAFIAPTDGTAICITDPGVVRLPYGGPS